MNNSSSWNCFPWKRRTDRDDKNAGKQRKDDVPDEQFANLLGGEFKRKIKQNLIKK